MKKETILILGAVAAGALLFISMRKKRPAYRIDVPAPEKITAEEFESATQKTSTSVLQKVTPILQTIFKGSPTKKAARKERRAARRAARKVGEFPDMC